MAYRDAQSRLAAGVGCGAGLLFFLFALPGVVDPYGNMPFWFVAVLVGPLSIAWIVAKLIVHFHRQ